MAKKVKFVERFPELAREVDYDLCNEAEVAELGLDNRHYQVWWKCSVAGHSYQRTVSSRIANLKKQVTPCTYCSGHTLLIGFNDLARTHPEIAEQWDYSLNYPLLPSQVFANDTNPVYWICELGHSTHTHPQARAIQRKRCGVCLNKVVQAGVNDLFSTNPELVSMWDFDRNSGLDPAKLTRQSKELAHWICSKGHRFESRVKALAALGSSCLYCGNREVSPGFNDLQHLHPEIAAEFDVDANGIGADKVLAGTADYFSWRCRDGHTWRAKVSNRVSRLSGCPGCAKNGFDPTKTGVFYVIASSKLGAMKVGITNPDSKADRIKGWKQAGWQVLFTFESDGRFIQSLELKMKRWIKGELGLPSYLSKQDVGIMRGASETFSAEGVSATQVVDKAKSFISLIR